MYYSKSNSTLQYYWFKNYSGTQRTRTLFPSPVFYFELRHVQVCLCVFREFSVINTFQIAIKTCAVCTRVTPLLIPHVCFLAEQ